VQAKPRHIHNDRHLRYFVGILRAICVIEAGERAPYFDAVQMGGEKRRGIRGRRQILANCAQLLALYATGTFDADGATSLERKRVLGVKEANGRLSFGTECLGKCIVFIQAPCPSCASTESHTF
jgi:hypothetical protein